jgi:hypothetical protein
MQIMPEGREVHTVVEDTPVSSFFSSFSLQNTQFIWASKKKHVSYKQVLPGLLSH